MANNFVDALRSNGFIDPLGDQLRGDNSVDPEVLQHLFEFINKGIQNGVETNKANQMAKAQHLVDGPLKGLYNAVTGNGQPAVEEETITFQTDAKPLWDLSTEIIRGNYGNGRERQQKLEEEGYNYHQVQDFVNKRIWGTLTDADYKRDYFNGRTVSTGQFKAPNPGSYTGN